MVCVATFMIVLANFSLALYTVSVDGMEVGGVLQRKIPGRILLGVSPHSGYV